MTLSLPELMERIPKNLMKAEPQWNKPPHGASFNFSCPTHHPEWPCDQWYMTLRPDNPTSDHVRLMLFVPLKGRVYEGGYMMSKYLYQGDMEGFRRYMNDPKTPDEILRELEELIEAVRRHD